MGKTTIDITMPSLGADMRDGTLVEWQVVEGDKVSKGDIIAVIETNKGAIDMECYHSGTISQILVQPVVSLPVGTVLARLEVEGELSDITPSSPSAPQSAESLSQALPKEEMLTTEAQAAEVITKQPAQYDLSEKNLAKPSSQKPTSRILASPVVRKLTAKNRWDLTAIKGSGPDGAILLRDVEGIAAKPASTLPDPGQSAPKQPAPRKKAFSTPLAAGITGPESKKRKHYNPEAMRTAIASAMELSKREIPHYYLSLDIDVTKTVKWLQAENDKREPDGRILLLALLLKATAQALARFPTLNGFYQQHQFEPGKGIHIGNAISLRDGGLVIPAIHDVDQLSADAIMQALRDVTERSRTGHLRTSELTDATITVTSIGDRGSDSVFGVIYPPQVAIVGFGRLRQAAIVKNGELVIADTITVTLSADHRVSDGTLGAKFLRALSNNLQKPEAL
ncbi:dihydrolipoamide acetyltransferase family protein [Photobacterium sp. J15]|uniref:dihydrolipoamide acetyltransferase family protein n=1 Tax=Photobacterium sp. J15 TaxID=265901 RepID=UPI0007E43520|nr:dihydrolipoamide acetyltransferase family protein [Photobacterium sp. J15]